MRAKINLNARYKSLKKTNYCSCSLQMNKQQSQQGRNNKNRTTKSKVFKTTFNHVEFKASNCTQ